MLAWLLKIGEPLPLDPETNSGRAAMLGEKLTLRGHQVVWWASSFDHQHKRMILGDRATVRLTSGITVRSIDRKSVV